MERPIPLARRQMPIQQQPEKNGISLSTTELVSILISMITLVIAFNMFGVVDHGIILGVILGITFHEVAHKFVAQSMGFRSKYKLWEIGLVLVIAFAIISRGRFIFAAPGFVVTEGMASTRQRGLISLSAPAANIFLAIMFFLIGGPWALTAAYVNILLAAFNLLPVPPLDGASVMEWSQATWSTAFIFTLLLGLVFLV